MSSESQGKQFQRRSRAWSRPSEVEPGAATDEQVDLMRQLVSAGISAPDFARAWLAARRRALDGGDRVREQFERILTGVFYLLDDYAIDPALRDSEDMTDDDLARRVRDALRELDAL